MKSFCLALTLFLLGPPGLAAADGALLPKKTVVMVPDPSPDLGFDTILELDPTDPRVFLLDEDGFLLDRAAMEQVLIERKGLKACEKDLEYYELYEEGTSALMVFGIVAGGLALLGGGIAIGYAAAQ